MKVALYLETHITVEPVFDERLEELKELAVQLNFKVASLLMKKRKEATPERSEYDTFLTGHDTDYLDMVIRTKAMVELLQKHDFKVWRYKIEDTLMDSRKDDYLGLNVKEPIRAGS